MATRYLKTAGGNWSSANTWSATGAGGADNAGAPGAGDDAILELLSGNCTIDASATCRSLDMTSGTGNYNALLTHGGFTLSIGTSTAGPGNVALKLVSGKYSNTGTTCRINFVTTSTTQQTIDYAGNSSGHIGFAGGSTSNLAVISAINSTTTSDTVTLATGIVHWDGTADNSGLSHTIGKFTTNAGTKTMYWGNSTTTVTGTTTAFTWSATSATLNEGTSIIICSGAGVTFSGGNETWYDVRLTGSGTAIQLGANTFTNLTRTGTATTDCAFQANGSFTVTGTWTTNGNSATNRLLVTSVVSAAQTSRNATLTGATVVTNHTDWQYIYLTVSGNLDLTAGGTKFIGNGGDVQSNYTITFTTGTDWYWKTSGAGTYNMEDYNYWFSQTNGGGSQMASTRVPLIQDNIHFDGTSITGTTTIDNNMARICKDFDFTGCGALNLHLNNLDQAVYGSVTFVSNLTLSVGSNQFAFAGRNATYYLTSAGKNFAMLSAQCDGGTLTLLDNIGSIYNSSVRLGTFNANGNNVTIARLDTSNWGTANTTVIMGSGQWYISGTYSNEAFRWGSASSVLTSTGSTLNLTNTGSAAVVLHSTSQNLTFNNIDISSGTGITTLNGSSTINVLTIEATAAKTVKFTAGQTTTYNSLVATGSSGKAITIASVTPGSPFTFVDTNGGTNENDYLLVTDCTGTPGSTWFYGANGTADAWSLAHGWAATNSGGVATGFMTTNSKFWGN